MFYKKRKMHAADQHNNDKNGEETSSQFCFVHRVGQLPLVSATIEQLLRYYDKTKKANRLFGASLHLAENSVKFAADTTVPLLKIFDAPIVATNKIACQQLEKLEGRYPLLLITPDELIKAGKSYYEKSYMKAGVDTAYSVVGYGEEKVRDSKKLVVNVAHGVLHMGSMKFSDYTRLGMQAVNETLSYSDSLIDAYIAPPSYAPQNGPVIVDDSDHSVVSRVYNMSSKMVSGLKYRAGHGLELTREQAHNALGQMQSVLFLIDYAKNTSQWMTEEAIVKLSAAQAQAAVLLREVKCRTEKYGKQPDIALLALVQNVAGAFVVLSDCFQKYSSPYLPENLQKNVLLAVQYAHELSDTFHKATTLGELKQDVIKEAKEKFVFVQNVFSSVLDRIVVYPPISWLATVSRTANGFTIKSSMINGEVSDGSVKRAVKNKVQ